MEKQLFPQKSVYNRLLSNDKGRHVCEPSLSLKKTNRLESWYKLTYWAKKKRSVEQYLCRRPSVDLLDETNVECCCDTVIFIPIGHQGLHLKKKKHRALAILGKALFTTNFCLGYVLVLKKKNHVASHWYKLYARTIRLSASKSCWYIIHNKFSSSYTTIFSII